MMRLARVAGTSMAPTYRPADLLVLSSPGRRPVRRGDVVVLSRGASSLVKRVVGVPGDVLELEAGRLRRRGRPVGPAAEPARPRGAAVQGWTVPAGSCFVVGDNLALSDDSRVWEEPFVPAADVQARVRWRIPAVWAGCTSAGRISPGRRAGAGPSAA
ncbi:signal peptidase I [Cellulomonas soli]